ncbi:class I SAM-dependent methyltransferase [Halosimplex pelagicum]|uniref:Class I SAM-dependent methyltransferase n=1 Tax=Halosimplex pelagicum TaxID=869886 RepID=A0A7D5T9H8_9EURY|nr:class I SAM-dependent methyltransferase [Halosimplex pelagicum]QLH81890.1 class I SAM-dependent methyltransferase [Halosimplex pelagicum]
MSNEEFEVEADFLTIGRTFAEYRRMFDLVADDIAGRAVLDCGGGAGAFTATAAELADSAVAVDPLFGRPAGELEPELDDAIEYNVDQLREKRGLFVWDFYGDVETRGRYLRAAAERFLADYATHPERYVAGALPDLPFGDDAVGLALVANLLFVYDDRLDRDFHLAALRDLARVAREEVRVFPLHSLDRTRSAFVEPVAESLRADGHAVAFREVPYEFQPGATEMLVVEPSRPTQSG